MSTDDNCFQSPINEATLAVSDKDTDITFVEDDVTGCDNSVVISSDLRQAINLLRSVPSPRVSTVRPRTTHSSRLTVTERSHRLSLPPQLPHHTVVDEHGELALAVRQCASLNDELAHLTTELRDPALSDQSADASKFVLPWKIRRVKKHKLDHVIINSAAQTTSSRSRRDYDTTLSVGVSEDDIVREPSRAMSADTDDDDVEETGQSGSSESLDSVVERILEDAALDSQRQRLAKRRRQSSDMASRSHWRNVDRLNRVQQQRSETTCELSSSKQKHSQHHSDNMSAGTSHHQKQQQQQQQERRKEKTLEDLFEEAVESLRDNVEYLTDTAASPPLNRHRRLRSAENWEKQILDSELHDECRHYRLQTYTSRDVSNVSRGFTVVQKLNKNDTAQHERGVNNVDTEQGYSKSVTSRSAGSQSCDVPTDVAYLQRTVISASKASSDTKPPSDGPVQDTVDLGLEVELAANEHHRTSPTSSSTWDSVSVDSLMMLDVDDATVHAATAALYSSSTVCDEEQHQMNNEFVDKLRRLQEEWQQSNSVVTATANTSAIASETITTGPTTTAGDNNEDDSDAVWIPMSVNHNDHTQRDNISLDTITTDLESRHVTELTVGRSDSCQPETDIAMTSEVNADNAEILSDCVTSQQIVINIKHLRRRHRRRRMLPAVPFREVRVRREMRYNDNDVQLMNSTSAICDDAVCEGGVVREQKAKLADVDGALSSTTTDGVILSADRLLTGDDLSTFSVDAKVEYDNKDSSRSVEQVPVYDKRGHLTSELLDVSRTEATRVLRLPGTSSSRLVYTTPTLVQTVDFIRRALLGVRHDGQVGVSCDAVETLTRRGDQSAPVEQNIFVDCLTPYHSCDADDDSRHATLVTS